MSFPLIVLEGGDGSGKATQAGLLKTRLQETIGPVSLFDFPRYEESLSGKLVGECLAGKHADFRRLSPYVASLPYVLDRIGAREDIAAKRGESIVMCNRYTPSNIAYQAAKLLPADRERFISFIEALEYDEFRIPRPTLVLYLHVPTAIATKLIERKNERGYLASTGEKKDQHERDVAYQEEVVRVYLDLARERDDWKVIECVDEKGELLPKEVIHEEVWKIVESHVR